MNEPIPADNAASRQRRPLTALFWLVPALTAAALAGLYHHERELASARIAALADLHARDISSSLAERMAEARFVRSSTYLVGLYRQHLTGDTEALTRLRLRLSETRHESAADTFVLTDVRGEPIHHEVSGDATARPAASPQLIAALQRASTTLAVQLTAPYAAPDTTIGVAVPLVQSGQPPTLFAVLQLPLSKTLLSHLRERPVPGQSAHISLWLPENGRLLPLTTRPAQWPAEGLSIAELPTDAILRQALQADAAGRPEPLVGQDTADHTVLAAVRPVAGTPWLLIAEENRNALWWDQAPQLLAILAVGAISLLALFFARRAWQQQALLATFANERRAQQNRLQQLAMSAAIAQGSSDLIFAKDLQGRYILFNPNAGRAYARAPEAVLGRNDEELYGSERAAELRAQDERVMREDAVIDFERHWPEDRYFIVTKGPLRDDNGQLIGLFGTMRDMSERRRLLQEAEREAHLRQALLEQAQDGVVALTLDGAVFLANASFARMIGRSREEAAGLKVWEWDAKVTAERAPIALRTQPATLRLFETHWRHADGHIFDVEVSTALVAVGEVKLVLCTCRDISTRKRDALELLTHRDHLAQLVEERTSELNHAVQARLESLQFLQNITDNMPGAVSYWDTDQRCRFANKAYARWLQSTPDQILGKHVLELLGPEVSRDSDAMMLRALAGEAQAFERALMAPDGQLMQTWTTYTPDRVNGERNAEMGGEVRGVFVAFHDVSQLKQTQRQLQQLNLALAGARDRAEAANQAKSAFLANMSHEIRTPMNAIIGLTYLMRQDLKDPSLLARLAQVNEAAQHLLAVINDILDLSKIEAGKMVLEETDFSLAAMLERTSMLVSETLRAKNIALQVETVDLPDRLRGDPTRLSQALLNLLHNAAKFTEHGSVTLRCSLLPAKSAALSVDDSTSLDATLYARFEVEDTGIGIAADKLGALFTPFEQGDSSTTRRHGGSGLGLAITRRLAELMGGESGVESALGVGSRFWFTTRLQRSAVSHRRLRSPSLMAEGAHANAWPDSGSMPLTTVLPAASGPAEEEGAGAPPSHQLIQALHAGARVLLVEDNPVNRMVATELLRAAGLSVDAAEDGVHAVERAAGAAYDVVLMDLQMPRMDGLEATRQIRAMPGRDQWPIVAMTASAFSEDRAACLAAGMDDHIAKPVQAGQLYDTLLRWLTLSRA